MTHLPRRGSGWDSERPSAQLTRSLTHTQNFLRRDGVVEELLDASSITAADTVLEIGAGRGELTAALAKRSRLVIAIEMDQRLFEVLYERLHDRVNADLHAGDFMRFELPREPYKVFANIPFDRTADIVKRLTTDRHRPLDAYLVVQRAAADRFIGPPVAPGTMASTMLWPYFSVSVVSRLRRSDFVPAPRVDVVLMRMVRRDPPLVAASDTRLYRDFIAFAFASWRGAVRISLKRLLTHAQWVRATRDLGIGFDSTPSQINGEQWLHLFNIVRTVDPSKLRGVHGCESAVARRPTHKVHRTREAPGWRSLCRGSGQVQRSY